MFVTQPNTWGSTFAFKDLVLSRLHRAEASDTLDAMMFSFSRNALSRASVFFKRASLLRGVASALFESGGACLCLRFWSRASSVMRRDASRPMPPAMKYGRSELPVTSMMYPTQHIKINAQLHHSTFFSYIGGYFALTSAGEWECVNESCKEHVEGNCLHQSGNS